MPLAFQTTYHWPRWDPFMLKPQPPPARPREVLSAPTNDIWRVPGYGRRQAHTALLQGIQQQGIDQHGRWSQMDGAL